jgi:predicted alpha/beta-fold hydrolase
MRAAGPFPPFFERPPWLTGDLQTLRNMIRRPFHDLAPWPERRLELPLADGDRLVAHSHRPDGAVSGVVILIHGLGGGADSVYVRATARHLLLNGYAVIRLNLRGAGASAPLCPSQPRLSGVLGRLKADALAVLGESDAGPVHAVRTVLEFDERFIAPRHGFADASDYYARSSAGGYLAGIGIPTMIIHGLNDPWDPAGDLSRRAVGRVWRRNTPAAAWRRACRFPRHRLSRTMARSLRGAVRRASC